MRCYKITDEQASILAADDRIVVVRACPGSGKTTIFVEKLKDIADTWPYHRKGIAALSFTNTASKEILYRAGSALLPPHFIGTLDSFVLRYVVLPFGHLLGLPKQGARLIPAPLDRRLTFSPFQFGSQSRDVLPISRFRFVGGSVLQPIMAYPDPVSKKQSLLPPEISAKALAFKRKNWKSNGIITHSDSHFLAAELLTHDDSRSVVIQTILKRFPVLLVDEFQDTMSFLSQSIVALLQAEQASGMVVGDPDQSIYEFGGAEPNLFGRVELLTGAQLYPMTVTQRFGQNIANVVSELSDSGLSITSALGTVPGVTSLAVHDLSDDAVTPQTARDLVDQLSLEGEVVILVRSARLAQALSAPEGTDSFPGGSQVAKAIDLAVSLLNSGENTKAANIVSRELWQLLGGGEKLPTKHELHERGIERPAWRRCLYKILLEANTRVRDECWDDWLTRVKSKFEIILSELGAPQKIGKLFRSDEKSKAKRVYGEKSLTGSRSNPRVMTIHQAKGSQFENVIVFLGKPHARNSPCISTQWWGASFPEERRVGFVALSRPKKTLVLCLHRTSFEVLNKQRNDFVKLFETIITV